MKERPTRREVVRQGLSSLAWLWAMASSQTVAESGGIDAEVKRSRPLMGVNLASAAFGPIPGIHNKGYIYPSRKHVDYYVNLGFNLIRLPFSWERLQPDLGGAFAPQEQKLLTDLVRYATQKGMSVIIDPHNYARRCLRNDGWADKHLIGSAKVPKSAFFDFWSRLSGLFKDEPRVFFGLMNEPHGIDAEDWLVITNGAIASIRATGASNLILVPGVHWTGAHSWIRAGNAAMAGVTDPINNFAFDVHQYFDSDSSGTHPEAVSPTIGSERIKVFQEWARAHGFRAILGEFNGGRDETSLRALRNICNEMAANPDVWFGWTAWAGGPWWDGDYMFNLEPYPDGRHREQTLILASYTRGP